MTLLSQPTILNVSHNYYVAGGSDRYFFELENLLTAKGNRVVPFCSQSHLNQTTTYSDYFPRSANVTHPGVVDLFRFVYSRDAKRKLTNLLVRENIDLAHLHIYYGKLTASILGALKSRGVPIVQTLHEYKLLCPVYTMTRAGSVCEKCAGGNYFHALHHLCNRGSIARSGLSVVESYVSKVLGAESAVDHFIGVSRFITEKMVEHGLPRDRITTIHNFVDTARFAPATEAGRYVLYFGRLENVKGVRTLLAAMKKLPDLQCVIAGEGSIRLMLESLIKRDNCRNISFVGFLQGEALADAIRGSICTVIPSEWYENCPLSVLESLAHARPVIGSRIGGIPELIEDGIDGYLFEPGDADDLAKCLELLCRNPNQAAEMGTIGRRKVRANFSPEQHYEKLMHVYRKTMSPKTSS